MVIASFINGECDQKLAALDQAVERAVSMASMPPFFQLPFDKEIKNLKNFIQTIHSYRQQESSNSLLNNELMNIIEHLSNSVNHLVIYSNRTQAFVEFEKKLVKPAEAQLELLQSQNILYQQHSAAMEISIYLKDHLHPLLSNEELEQILPYLIQTYAHFIEHYPALAVNLKDESFAALKTLADSIIQITHDKFDRTLFADDVAQDFLSFIQDNSSVVLENMIHCTMPNNQKSNDFSVSSLLRGDIPSFPLQTPLRLDRQITLVQTRQQQMHEMRMDIDVCLISSKDITEKAITLYKTSINNMVSDSVIHNQEVLKVEKGNKVVESITLQDLANPSLESSALPGKNLLSELKKRVSDLLGLSQGDKER
jgi:hypothetical protein